MAKAFPAHVVRTHHTTSHALVLTERNAKMQRLGLNHTPHSYQLKTEDRVELHKSQEKQAEIFEKERFKKKNKEDKMWETKTTTIVGETKESKNGKTT